MQVPCTCACIYFYAFKYFYDQLRFMYWQSIYMFIFWITRLITDCYICLFMHSVNSNILREVIFLTDEETLIPVTLWVVCDVETPEGRELLYSAIRQLVSSSYCLYCLEDVHVKCCIPYLNKNVKFCSIIVTVFSFCLDL